MRVGTALAFRGYRWRDAGADLVAGVTVWAVLVPEALAYATIAGVPPVVGLSSVPAALILYALFGSSRQLVVGPMAATAVLSGAAVVSVGHGRDAVALTAGLAIVAGVLGVLAGLARLGFVASFISIPVLKGFVIGLSLTIIVGQLPGLVGVPAGSGDFFAQAWHLLTSLGRVEPWTAAVGLISLLVVLGLRRINRRLPAPLIAMVLAIAAVPVFGLSARGVAVVGPVDSGLPPFGLPGLAWSDYVALAGSAGGILVVGFAEGIGAARTYATAAADALDPNRELFGVGMANLGSGLSSGMVVNGSLSKTAVNATAGAASQVSALFVAGLTVLTLLFLTGLFANLPKATLAAVVVAAVIDLVDITSLRRLARVYTPRLGGIYGVTARADFIAAVTALTGVLVLGTLPGLAVGAAASVVLLLYHASRPNVAVLGRPPGSPQWMDVQRHPGAATEPGIVVLRPEAALFYANADNVAAAVWRHVRADTRAVVLDVADVPEIDVTAALALHRLVDQLGRRHIRLYLARDIGQVRDVLRAAGFDAIVKTAHPTVESAVESARADSTAD